MQHKADLNYKRNYSLNHMVQGPVTNLLSLGLTHLEMIMNLVKTISSIKKKATKAQITDM